MRVLIVEDEPPHAELEIQALQRAGFAPSWMLVDTEAAYVAALSPQLDLILADNSLPRFNALRAADLLRESGLDVPLIVVSGTIGEEAAVALLKRGVADYLLKDRLSRLGAAVDRALQARRLRREKERADNELRERLNRLEAVRYHAVPVIAKGRVVGVLELFHRRVLVEDHEWLSFLEAIAAQAAIAIDVTAMFTNLERSNVDLARAYDTTIEGWSRALDLRDKEKEGHSERVTRLTLRMARAMNLPDSELVHVRRGALLHDIGKMGIPDHVLLKPGPLSPEEQELMRKHPVFAHKLLAPITYLQPALAIPYCHHERWDGTGYPRGLNGAQIPLVARIFALVDVWDAMRSDRPYRPALSRDQALAYIREQSGRHFDPDLAALFLRLLDEQPPTEAL